MPSNDRLAAHVFVVAKDAGCHRLEIENVDDEKPAGVEALQSIGEKHPAVSL